MRHTAKIRKKCQKKQVTGKDNEKEKGKEERNCCREPHIVITFFSPFQTEYFFREKMVQRATQ